METNKWISVKESLPKKGGDYLVTDGSVCMVGAFRTEAQYWHFWNVEWWSNEDVTHWMELPKSPNE